ncbi:MFS family permease [Cytobacillus horneckiae]|uniref:MFS transporter n=1 Tax=Cytobacillus horneckiae TaxID=549687 RepID=A0A2N0ZNE2_9BACI|nr:MFS transporter [Cytobacillus horneckiae]NRG47140.1 MFS transporter [Bacillus sp. CRN 9]MBN6889354.1 MFS transporter [Cytobacillus horneckiae]MCM3179485.1 MFS transporter [Cytobacillus horneckiae]MEC1154911.1 MFS transporter [Cytobacillus horneckiae]MED2936183.1 MFS transporter [Cytobacillus horneckiae]
MPRALWLLVIGMAVNVTGSSFLWPLNTIFIHDQLGKSLSVAGVVLMLNAGATVIGNLIGGSLFDTIGGYRSVLIGIGISLLSLFGMVFWHGWPEYIVFLTILGFGSGIVFPSMYAMAGSVWKEGGRKSFNAMYVATNLGVAIGAALAGLIASYSFDYIFIANALMYVVFLFIAVFGYRNLDIKGAQQTSVIQERTSVRGNPKLYALFILLIGYILCWVGYVQWQSTISSYTQEIGISLKQYSMLWTINGALIVLGQPLVNLLVKRVKSLKTQIIIGILIFAVSFGIVGSAQAFSGFLAAMIILTIGEMLVWPAVPTIANDLAPKGREGFYQGIVNSTATGGRMIGPLLGGVLVDLYGMQMLFGILMLLLLVSIYTTLIYDKKLNKKKPVTAVSS